MLTNSHQTTSNEPCCGEFYLQGELVEHDRSNHIGIFCEGTNYYNRNDIYFGKGLHEYNKKLLHENMYLLKDEGMIKINSSGGRKMTKSESDIARTEHDELPLFGYIFFIAGSCFLKLVRVISMVQVNTYISFLLNIFFDIHNIILKSCILSSLFTA